MEQQQRIMRFCVALALTATVAAASAQPTNPPSLPPPVMGWIPCPNGGDADFTVSIVDGRVAVGPNGGDARIKTHQVIRWFGAAEFRLRLELDEQAPEAEPAPLPADWSPWKERLCYRVGKGPYVLKYSVQVADPNVPILDPRIIIDR